MSGREVFDLTSTDKKLLESRAARRTILRNEFLKKTTSPYVDENPYMVDTGIQRYMTMRAVSKRFFEPTKSHNWATIWSLVPIGLALYFIIGSKDRHEHQLRTGQISYRDREFKFR